MLGFFIAGLFIPFMSPLNLWSAALEGRKDFKHRSIYSASAEILRVSSLIAILCLTANIAIIIAVYFMSQTLLHACLTFVFCRLHRPNDKASHGSISYGKHMSLMTVLGSISTQADKIILWHFLGPVALATYTIALTRLLFKLNHGLDRLSLWLFRNWLPPTFAALENDSRLSSSGCLL
jgi:O-antigen/teichoic acid export membrane protein